MNDHSQAFRSQEAETASQAPHPFQNREIELDIHKRLSHHCILIEDIEIFFPHKPYSVQVDYMRNVITALNTHQNGLLQSPTGTGKTLAMLCATLGWLRHRRRQLDQTGTKGFNRILFCSRTHSQLKQIVRELKSTAYKPKLCILASRDQYCLKKEFTHLKDLELNGACKKSVEDKSCSFYNYSLKDKRQVPRIFDDVLDIEDLQKRASMASSASCGKFCPYYYSREIKDEADIVILPYNFLLQQNRFVNFQVILKDAIIIFDEAHNVPSSAEEGTSYKVDQNLISESLKELEYLSTHLTIQMRTKPNDIKDAQTLVLAFGNLLKHFEASTTLDRQDDGSIGKLTGMAYFFEMIQQIQCQLHVSKKSLNQVEANKKWHKEVDGQQKFDYKVMLSDLKSAKDKKKQLNQFATNPNSSNSGSTKANNSISQPTLFNFSFKKTITPAPLLSLVKFNFKDGPAIEADVAAAAAAATVSVQKVEEPEEDCLDLDPSSNVSFEKINKVCKKLSNIITDMQTMKCQNIDFFAGFITGICAMHETNQTSQRTASAATTSTTAAPLSHKVSDFYRFYFQKGMKANEKSTINLWCLDPSLAFQNISKQQPFSILLTSGTLEPMNSWDNELRIPFGVKLVTCHVIDSNTSVVAAIVNAGRSGVPLNFSYSNRLSGNSTYEEMGEFLIDLSSKVPNGILVCFSSSTVLRLTKEAWIASSNRIITRMNQLKELFFEPPNNIELTQVMKRYCSQAIDDSKGAILFCVCRGKVSEGIDFTDKLARAVVVVGVPFPPSADTWVCTKMKYLDSLSSIAASKSDKGKDWYFLSTVRAMNQAVGRVIRHKDDFGTVLLCDNRFNQQQFQDNISRWVKDSLKSYESYSTLLESIALFFQKKKEDFTSLDKLLKFGGVGSGNPLSERSIENNKITSHTFEHKSAHMNAQIKRYPELSYASKFASAHQFTAIFAENQMIKGSQLNNDDPEEQSDKPAQFADGGLLQNNKKFDLEGSYLTAPKRKNLIYQQKRQNNISSDLNDSLLSKKENSFDSQSLENSMSAAEHSQNSKPFSKFPQTNAGASLGFAAAASSATDWTSNLKEIAGRSQNRRSAISQASALMDGLNNSFDFNKRNNASEKKQASGGELSSNYISEIFREYEDQDSSDEDSRKKVIIPRRQKSSLTFLSNENSKNACTPLSFADQLKLNLRNITPPGQQSSASPQTPRSFTPKATKNTFDKAMLCNNSKGLGSFNIGDIISMKLQETKDARNQNLQTIKECPQEENDHIDADADNQKEMRDNQKPNFDDALMCPICYETPKNNHINTNCSHKACLECWKKWLNQQLTCPMCRTRCRMAYLEPCQ